MMEAEDYIKPVGRATLPQEVVNAMTELMLKRIWKPGDLIPSEKELAARFGVGRSTIREALRSLVMIGVLEARPGEGSFVREATSGQLSGAFRWGLLLNPGNLDDFVDVRVCVETECAGRAATTREKHDVEAIYAGLEGMRANCDDDERYMAFDNAFHVRIAECTKNGLFVSMVSTIQSIVRLWFPVTYRLHTSKDLSLAEHEAIAKAIKAGNEAKARQAMQRHVSNAADRLRRVLSMQVP